MSKKEFQKRVKLAGRSDGCLNGELDISYAKLVELLGEPNAGTDGYKTDAEWSIEFDGVPFSIYNYKDGKNYLGSDGLDVEDIRDWHIGGSNKEKAAEFIKLASSVK